MKKYYATIKASMEIVKGTETVVEKRSIPLSELKQVLGKVMELGYDKIDVSYRTEGTVEDNAEDLVGEPAERAEDDAEDLAAALGN